LKAFGLLSIAPPSDLLPAAQKTAAAGSSSVGGSSRG
jgi:hypothetical protein